jgi:hypothetical protein
MEWLFKLLPVLMDELSEWSSVIPALLFSENKSRKPSTEIAKALKKL